MAGQREAPDRQTFMLFVVGVSLMLAGCTSGAAEPVANPALPTVAPAATAAPLPTAASVASPEPTAALAPTPEPTITPVGALADAKVIGDLAPAPPGSHVVALPGAGIPQDDGAMIVPVYDEPGGPARTLVDRNQIDGVQLTYPLRNPTVFDQPLVLRVIAGSPGDEWLLVQAPVRPHRQYVWVRSADFTFGNTSLRIEVDLGREGRFALFDGEREMINNLAVYGRESRPTVLHDTYVEQAFDASVLSPAYGSYILTIASYSQTLGTYGGGGLPGQSLHGTNQPELVGQRVSSGGIRVPNGVIEFVYAQPGLLGASVLIYDSTGIGRDAAIALQRNEPWTRAETTDADEIHLLAVPIPSYS